MLEKQQQFTFSNFTKFLQLQIFASYFIKLSTFSSLLLLSPEKGWTNGWGFEVLNHSAGAFKKVVLGHTSIMDRFVTMITIIIGNYQFFPKKGVFVTLVLEHGEASKDADIRILFEVRNASILGPAFGGQIFYIHSKVICTYFKIKDGEIVLIQLIQFKLPQYSSPKLSTPKNIAISRLLNFRPKIAKTSVYDRKIAILSSFQTKITRSF